MAESAEILALVERGYLRIVDIAALLGVSRQRAGQITQRSDFPAPAKLVGERRLWRRRDVERWRDARSRVWAPVEDA
jgi:predicted DNA-binding transcriptional regulator AlpA